MEPRIQYAKTEDGVSIADWSMGEGPAFVCTAGWFRLASNGIFRLTGQTRRNTIVRRFRIHSVRRTRTHATSHRIACRIRGCSRRDRRDSLWRVRCDAISWRVHHCLLSDKCESPRRSLGGQGRNRLEQALNFAHILQACLSLRRPRSNTRGTGQGSDHRP